VTRVEIGDASSRDRLAHQFDHAWESDVPYLLSYMYDRGFTFGVQYRIDGHRIQPVVTIPDTVHTRFEQIFADIRTQNPVKYALLDHWFTLCTQPIPDPPPERLLATENVDPEQYHLAVMLSRVANLPLPQAYTSHQVSFWIKSLLHQYLRQQNILIPTSRELRREEDTKRIQGALTFQPETGIYFNTVVTDFESLYPSLIDAYNLSHETINCPHTTCERYRVPGLDHWVCTQRRGVYSVLIGALKDLRIHWYKPRARDPALPSVERRLAHATSQLLKLILVSSYGVTIRMHGLSRPSLAESITAYGRHSLQTTWDLAKKKGLHTIYGDTDSLFLDNPREDQVDALIKTVKEQLALDLAVDERYAVCVLPRAMKTYFGIRRDGTADIKGVTAIKSNSPRFIQQVFRDSVKAMAGVRNRSDFDAAKTRIQRLVDDSIDTLTAGKVPFKDLEYQVELHEDPLDKLKDSVLHQPYQCAIQLIDAGHPVSKRDLVHFVKVTPFRYRDRTFTVKPTQDVKSLREVNVEDYVRNLRSALNQTFKPMDLQFTEKPASISLSDFM
jgi:DNA polymerase I